MAPRTILRFRMVNGNPIGHSPAVKITEEVCKYADEQGVAEEGALKQGMVSRNLRIAGWPVAGGGLLALDLKRPRTRHLDPGYD